MKIVKADWSQHKEVCRLARSSPYSKGFEEMYYIQEYYKKGDVLLALRRGKIVGFIAVRHLVRKPYTSVYYMASLVKRQGVGRALIAEVTKLSPWRCIRLISEKANEEGLAFYKSLGFTVTGEGANKQGEPYWVMEWR